ncbi:Protein of unknown function [Pyronema omphalodes CBS 100304]|uniref:Uncharacterized protein n=1 Tax=Pyronema omphalodes (strain CBS 100304) TaxID=1076935 RepID=U4LTL8_PYROM|nr:Protein of unknown function [Pyronema omphalodes CBS 100304]
MGSRRNTWRQHQLGRTARQRQPMAVLQSRYRGVLKSRRCPASPGIIGKCSEHVVTRGSERTKVVPLITRKQPQKHHGHPGRHKGIIR